MSDQTTDKLSRIDPFVRAYCISPGDSDIETHARAAMELAAESLGIELEEVEILIRRALPVVKMDPIPEEEIRESAQCFCSNCGSHEVERLDWVNPNTGEVVGGYEGVALGDLYCEECCREGRHPNPQGFLYDLREANELRAQSQALRER